MCLLKFIKIVFVGLAAIFFSNVLAQNADKILGTGDLIFKYETGIISNSSPAIGSDSTIYIGSYENGLYAVNPDGTLKWNFETGGTIASSPAIGSDGTIYIGSRDNILYAVNPDGTLKWKFVTEHQIIFSPAISIDGTIYITSSSYHYAINSNGTLKWKSSVIGNSNSTPVIGSDGTIYNGSSNNNLYAIGADGTLIWKYYLNSCSTSLAIGSDGTIYVSSHQENNGLYAINPNGSLKWKLVNIGDIEHSSPAIDVNGTIYVGSVDSTLYAINSNGTIKWNFPTTGKIRSSPAIGSDGTIYIGSGDSNLYAINSDGTLKWKYLTDDSIYSSPVISSEGTIYFGSYDGLYAIDSGTNAGAVDSAWPMFGHDLFNSHRADTISVSQLVLQGIDNDGTNWWVSGTYNGIWRLYKVASDRSTILASYYLPHSTDPSYIEYIQAIACRSGYVYVLIFPSGPIYKLDPSDGSYTTSPYSTRNWTSDITSLGSTLWQTRDLGPYEVYSSAGDEFTLAEIPGPKSITSDGTYLYIGDVYGHKIYQVNTSGQVLNVYFTQSNQPNHISYLSSENAIYSYTHTSVEGISSIVKVLDLSSIQTYTLTITVNQAEWGTTVPSVGEHICYEDSVVNITALPYSGYRFVNWIGDVASPNSASTTVTINGNKTVTANFEFDEPTQVSQLVLNGIDNDGTNWWVSGTYNGIWRLYKVASDRSTILASYYFPHSTDPLYIEYINEIAYRDGYVYVRIHPKGPIYKVDPSDGSYVKGSYFTRRWNYDMTFMGSTLWQTCGDDITPNHTIYSSTDINYTIDTSTFFYFIEVPGWKCITSDGTYLYLGGYGHDKIYQVTTSGQIINSFTVMRANQPRRISYLSSENAIYSYTLTSVEGISSIVKVLDLSSIQTYTLTITVNQDEWGTTVPSVGEHNYYEDSVVNITALPDSGYRFVNWIGDVASPNSASTTVTINGNKTVTANFEITPQHTLTIAVNQDEWGTTNPPVGDHILYEDTVVNITALPDSGYRFVNWIGAVASPNSATTTVTIDGNKAVTANFKIIRQYTLTIAVNQDKWGITNPPVGDHILIEDTIVNITALPDSGYRFVNWIGDVASPNSATTTVTIDGNKTVTANFEITPQHTLTMAVNQDEWGTTNPPVGEHIFYEDSIVNIAAKPNSGYLFVNWEGDIADSNSVYTTVTINSDKIIKANFTEYSLVPWSPTPLEISVRDEVTFIYDGSGVDIPVDISGKPAKCYLIINTRLPEDQLPHQVTNGYLGWHYVNRIDTTVYISGAYNFTPGSHTITWDRYGTENTSGGYGGTYEKIDQIRYGTYDYYVWGYDDQSPREPVCNFLPISFYWQPQYTKFGEYDEADLPRTNPLIWGNIPYMYDNLHGVGPPRWTAFKFELGNDPDDISKLQTTFMPGFTDEDDIELDASPISFDPFDQNYFYCMHVYTSQKKGALHKWKWVNNGNAEIVDGWGGWDKLVYITASRRGMGEYMPAVVTDTNYIMITSPGRNPYEIQHDVLYIVDFDGNKVIDGQMLDDVYFPDNPNEVSTNGMINRAFACREVPYWITMGGEQTCITQVADCSRLVNGEGDDEYIVWRNGNGDYFQDSAWDPTVSQFHWNCSSGAYRNINGARRSEAVFDKHGIHIMFPMYQALNSILVYTQDGSGVSYAKFADDYSASDKNKKGSGQRVDTGSQFDGLYIGDVVGDEINYGVATQHVNWIGFDSAHGIIHESWIGDEVETPTVFSVDAAYPNPANPNTTIGFTLAEAGHVTIDIYNVAGQKVDTLVDDEMIAGKHSVVWDGSGFSAGIYLYTVKSGKFSKTMKVTLLK